MYVLTDVLGESYKRCKSCITLPKAAHQIARKYTHLAEVWGFGGRSISKAARTSAAPTGATTLYGQARAQEEGDGGEDRRSDTRRTRRRWEGVKCTITVCDSTRSVLGTSWGMISHRVLMCAKEGRISGGCLPRIISAETGLSAHERRWRRMTLALDERCSESELDNTQNRSCRYMFKCYGYRKHSNGPSAGVDCFSPWVRSV